MHLHAIATLKVIIGTTHTDDPNGIHVDKDNNTIQANGKEPVANGKTIDQNGTGNTDGDKVVLTVDGTAKQSTETASGSGDNSEEVQVSRSEKHKFRDRSCSNDWSDSFLLGLQSLNRIKHLLLISWNYKLHD